MTSTEISYAAPSAKRIKGSEEIGKGSGYGKLILFGEHFVVKPFTPAIVAAVAMSTTCTITLSPDTDWSRGLIVEDNRPAVVGYKAEKNDGEMMLAIEMVLTYFKMDHRKRGVKLEFAGDLCAVSGIGASAAQCVALSRALGDVLHLNLTEEQVNAGGYEGEKAYHGTPSGIDNTASTFGGLLKFQRTDKATAPKFEKLVSKAKDPCRIIYASTGITSSTTKVVGDVQQKREKDPEWYKELEKKYIEIYAEAEKSIAIGDWVKLGHLVNENHTLLQELTVSCPELDALVKAARDAGAIGAKMSGTGRGGLMFAIAPDAASEEKIFTTLKKLSPDVWVTTFGE